VILQRILEALLDRSPAFRAAVLLDYEGETVVAAARSGNDHDYRVLGAYQGIFLRDLLRAFARCDLGAVRSFWMEQGGMRVLTETLSDGYYVILAVNDAVPLGLAAFRVANAAEELRALL
jgi:predicted regulator of Ras-like GTPase activity (Roadblock/LC7/MglB family)